MSARHGFDHDVVIVGGGPAGCSAGVFCGRAGLDTAIFDRGRSSLQRCAHLENYLGFPAGIDIETFYALIHNHAETAGCTLVSDLVESVTPTDDGDGFVIDPQEGDSVTTRRVVAATRYDGEYLRGLDTDAAMFTTAEEGGETHETFDRHYPDPDGTTPVERLYIATPSEADRQAIMAAGRGARVGRRVSADARVDDGWWEEPADNIDWVREEANLDEEWADRDRWLTWFDSYYGADAPVEQDTDRYQRVRAASTDRTLSSYISPEEIEERAGESHERLLDHIDDDRIIERAQELQAQASADD